MKVRVFYDVSRWGSHGEVIHLKAGIYEATVHWRHDGFAIFDVSREDGKSFQIATPKCRALTPLEQLAEEAE